jgi:hypothetical protein
MTLISGASHIRRRASRPILVVSTILLKDRWKPRELETSCNDGKKTTRSERKHTNENMVQEAPHATVYISYVNAIAYITTCERQLRAAATKRKCQSTSSTSIIHDIISMMTYEA